MGNESKNVIVHFLLSILGGCSLVTAFGMAMQVMYLWNVFSDAFTWFGLFRGGFYFFGGIAYGFLMLSYIICIPKHSKWRDVYLILFAICLAIGFFTISNIPYWISIRLPLEEWLDMETFAFISPALFAILLLIARWKELFKAAGGEAG